MDIRESFIIAGRSLRSYKLRSMLTTFGIIIGVAAVIVLVGLGNGVKAGFNSNFGAMANQLTIQQFSGNVIGGTKHDLTDADAKALTDTSDAPHVQSVTPMVSTTTTATYGQNKMTLTVTGSTTGYLTADNRTVQYGQNFTAAQQDAKARVVLIGQGVVNQMFGGEASSAVGQLMRLGRSNYTVIGVLKTDGQSDEVALMPIGTMRSALTGITHALDSVIIKATGVDTVNAAQTEIYAVLDKHRDVKDVSSRDYRVFTLAEQLENVNRTLTYLTWFTVGVAGLSLIVGGMGVANIMLVSVTERTREVGIRKAVGARRSAIMKQFLTESTVLASLGGLAGAVLGIGVTLVLAEVIPKTAPRFGTPTVSLLAVATSFLFSTLVGLVAGTYPAWRAATLRPIEALRYQ
jgi:putative ABC transport system permease protein